jgi:hypothetical protein
MPTISASTTSDATPYLVADGDPSHKIDSTVMAELRELAGRYAELAAPIWLNVDPAIAWMAQAIINKALGAHGINGQPPNAPEPPRPVTTRATLTQCRVCGGYGTHQSTQTYAVRRQGWLKIGRTGQLAKRLRQLRRRNPTVAYPPDMDWAAPLDLMGVWGDDHEHQLHERFSRHHVVGEWFTAAPVVKALHLSTTSPWRVPTP